MAKFRYSMHNVLEIKYKLEEQAKTAFSQAQQNVNMAKEELASLYERKEQYQETKKDILLKKINVQKLNECQMAMETMDYYIVAQKKKLAALEAVLDNARRKLNEAMVDCKTHEKLKEKEYEIFLQELNNQEKKEIDELVSFQYNDTLKYK